MENPGSGKQRWQYAFLAGVVACIVSAFVVLDNAVFASIVTISTLAIGLVNSLLSPASSQDQGWILSKIKLGLNVSRFLKTATILIWLVTIGVSGYGALRYYSESRKVNIEGYVIAANGEPAAGAIITLFLSGNKESITTADGKFIFSKIDISKEPSKQIRMEVIWKDTTKEETIDLATGPLQGLMIKLPPGTAPFRISYISLDGGAIDLLMRGELDSRTEKMLSGNPFIVPNSVFNHVKNLMKQFSAPFELGEGGTALIEKTGQDNQTTSSADDRLATKHQGKLFFRGTDGASFSSSDLSAEDIASMLAANGRWAVEIIPDKVTRRGPPGSFELSSLYFWRYANPADLTKFQQSDGYVDKRLEFLKSITRDSMPDDFCLLVVSNSVPCGGEGDQTVAQAELVPRILKMQIAVLENTTSQPIHIGKFIIKENIQDSLRARKGDESALNTKTTDERSWFPQEELRPHEALVIPIGTHMAYDLKNNTLLEFFSDSFLNQDRETDRSRVIKQLSALDKLTFSLGEENRTPVTVKSQDVKAIAERVQKMNLTEEYSVGPSINIDSVVVNRVNYPVRQYSSSNLAVLLEGSQIGSCPYVYTYSSTTNSWVNEGHVLFNVNHRSKETTDEMRLHRFDGRVRIKERDPEISFIDSIYIKARLADGHEKVFYPRNSLVRFADSKYLNLRRGDEIEISFDMPAGFQAQKCSLVIRGYYIPLQ